MINIVVFSLKVEDIYCKLHREIEAFLWNIILT